MRLLVAVTLALGAMTLGAGSAVATHSSGVGPGMGLISGTGDIAFLGLGEVSNSQIHVNANSTPSSGGPFGEFFTEVTGFGQGARFRGVVTCLDVAANEARVGGVVIQSDSPLVPPGTNTVGRFIDNGDSDRHPDFAVGEVGVPTATCTLYMQPPETVRAGGFVVHSL
jgi:hypothetical protein